MTEALRHRGPDDSGIHIEERVALGHRRLSIIDLSPLGHQPMFSADRRLCIVFNGEIYNFQELRDRLVSKGHSFLSNSDTEVILAAYREYGPDCLAHLQGMFAFAIWDRANETLFAARDRLGKKPLYYYADGRSLVFASELRSLMRLRWISLELDLNALDSYFALQYIPGPRTVFRRISKLQPGHFLLARDFGRQWHVQRYWHPERRLERDPDSLERARNLIEDSVKRRLVADVEIGVLLSGGLDSSLITAIAARRSGKKLKTFSVGFSDERLNELACAERVARLFETDHHAIVADDVTPGTLADVIDHLDEPLGDPACIPTYLVAQFAARHVKVVLSGEGADELFGGYRYYPLERMFAAVSYVPEEVRHALGWLLATRPLVYWLSFADRLSRALQSRPEASVARWVTVFGSRERQRYFSDDFLAATRCADPLSPIYEVFAQCGKKDLPSRGLEVDLRTWLPDDLLMKVDKMTMANSLEARAPFLDQRLAEYMMACSTRVKFGATSTKLLLKRLALQYLPIEVTRRRKHGFEVPIAAWMRRNFREAAEECFSARALREVGLFKSDEIRCEWSRFVSSEAPVAPRRMWTMFAFMQWHRHHLGRNGSVGVAA